MLLIIFAGLTVILAAVLWIASVILQGYLYNDVAPRLPFRALGGAAVLALFLTGWCAVYRADPGRFDTLTNFKTEALDGTYDEFQSVRKVAGEERPPVRYLRRGDTFEAADTRKRWARSDGDGMVVAILVKEKGKDEPTRFDANLIDCDGRLEFPPRDQTRYQAGGGKRYMDEVALGKVYRVRGWAYVGNFFANFLHLALWAVVLWLVMRFALGHAIGIGLALWAITMLAVQPALFGLVTK